MVPAPPPQIIRTMKNLDTLLVTAGRDAQAHAGAVNVPPYRASTITHPSLAAFEDSKRHRYDKVVYGRLGTPSTFAFEETVAAIEGAERTVAVSSGMAGCAAAILACVKAGDHMLIPDSVYLPVRNFAGFLAGFGVESSFYDPALSDDIAALIRPNTRLIYLESPGSLTLEIQDVPAIARIARGRGVLTAIDNTWATPLLFRPLEHGVDLSICAATKYLVGHSDAMLGAVSGRRDLFERVKTAANHTGNCPGSEEVYLGLRGLRTLAVRLKRHGESALMVARWLQRRPEIERVLYPALPEHPTHALWRRDFSGASGLLSACFKPCSRVALAAFVDGLEHFGIGASFGGYESLVLPFDATPIRTVTEWRPAGPCLRFHVGLENPDDLIRDLESGFARLQRTV